MLESLDGTGRAPSDAGNRLDGQVCDEPEDDHLPLIGGETVHGGDQRRVDWLQRIRARSVRDGSPGGHRSPRASSGVVDDPIASQGEDPLPHGKLVASHTPQVSGDLEEDLTQDVFGIRDALRSEVAEDGGRELPVESRGIPT